MILLAFQGGLHLGQRGTQGRLGDWELGSDLATIFSVVYNQSIRFSARYAKFTISI